MECNKEEALRAKSIAESKMQKKDFEGAQKIALKAQRLFPELESISQILAVCEVHCATATKIAGETDWYAILQVDMTADESTIKKQFRKLALLLHPDKNKLAGAEGAFQQIGNAYKILSDPAKRLQHDMVRRTNFSGVVLNQAARQTYRPVKKQPGPGVSSFAHFNGLNHDQSFPFSNAETFWTICPSCSVRFLYHHNIMKKKVQCIKCFHIFAAYDMRMPSKLTTENSESDKNPAPATSTKIDHVNASTTEFQRAKPKDSLFNQATKLEDGPESFGEPEVDTRAAKVEDGKVEDGFINSNEIKFQKVQLKPIHNPEKVEKPLASQKRSINEGNQNAETSGDRQLKFLRRSNRHKPNVPCNEVQDASTESRPPSKRSRLRGKQVNIGQTNTTFPPVISDSGREEYENSQSECNASLSPGCNNSVDLKNLSYPAPEFFNFDTERNESKFAVDQIWALYDDIDGMPRFYARVKKVYRREFKLQLCWLENYPVTVAEMEWSKLGLPVACGGFKLGKTFVTHDQQTFSHLVSWSKGNKRNLYVIYPRKGEIWALFSDWNIGWRSEPDKHRVHKFQVVEVVSDFQRVAGISVVPLVKIKKFMSVFMRAADDKDILLEIPARDVLMFSHRIPACRMTGKEEDGVPEGSFELDCASLPSNFNVTFPSISIEVRNSTMPNVDATCNNACPENPISLSTAGNGFEGSERNPTDKPRPGMSLSPSQKINGASESEIVTPKNEFGTEASLSFEYPESEFYDFESDRLMSKFESGQIWAFYCEIDNFPKYYGKIRAVDLKNNKIHVRWLAANSTSEEDDRCAEDKPPPPSCGIFRAIKESCTMDSGESFSYLAKAKLMPTKGHYYIFPEVGEIWAVFRNWNADSSAIELRNGEFDIIEISASDALEVKGLVLVKVGGYISVFCRKSDSVMSISCHESLRFSHRIPAHGLTKEMGSSDFWELDPAALPSVFLTPKP